MLLNCKKHPDYEARRRPKVECVSCWRLYLENRGTTVDAYASSLTRQERDLSEWLKGNMDAIIYAPLEEAVASIVSEMEFIPEKDEPQVEIAENKTVVQPARGTVV